MIRDHHLIAKRGTMVLGAAFSLSLAAPSCSAGESTVLICKDTSGRGIDQSWVLTVNASKRSAEMVVHVPAESIARGTPAGNRHGTALVSERAYEITIPGDSGGKGDQSWIRLQFQFEIDRYTGTGTLWIGEAKYGKRVTTPIRCEPGQKSPRF